MVLKMRCRFILRRRSAPPLAAHHLGCVPRAKNEAPARLMDAGKLLFAKLESKSDSPTPSHSTPRSSGC
jgi:hypothetical protein